MISLYTPAFLRIDQSVDVLTYLSGVCVAYISVSGSVVRVALALEGQPGWLQKPVLFLVLLGQQ